MSKDNVSSTMGVDIDVLVGCLVAVGIIAILAGPLGEVRMMEWWWGFFMLCNLGYILYGMKKGFVKGGAENGMVIAMGPVAFYTWTIVMAWRKYKPRRFSNNVKNQT